MKNSTLQRLAIFLSNFDAMWCPCFLFPKQKRRCCIGLWLYLACGHC